MIPPSAHSIIGVGAAILDRVLYVSEEFVASHLGNKGSMQPINKAQWMELLKHFNLPSKLSPGGSSANVIRALAELKHPCAFIGKVGNDENGHYYIDQLNSLKITSYCSFGSMPTGQVLSFVTPDGERTFRSFLGSNLEFTENDLSLATFHSNQLAHIEGYTLYYPNVTKRAMEYAKISKAKISFDLGNYEVVQRFKDVILELLPQYVDICFANEKEAEALTGLPAKQACELLKDLCPIAIVSLGKEGCWVGSGNTMEHYPANPVIPVDTTGAGDLFAAGFLHGYLTEKSLEECARYGALLGAAVVQIEGAFLDAALWNSLRPQLM